MTESKGIITKTESKSASASRKRLSFFNVFIPVSVAAVILCVVVTYEKMHRNTLMSYGDYTTTQLADNIADEVSITQSYAESRIINFASYVSSSMKLHGIKNPEEVTGTILDKLPFDSLEFISCEEIRKNNRSEYYKALDGKDGVWINYNSSYANDVILNFYTPLILEDRITGVLSGSIMAEHRIKPFLKKMFYEYPVHGILYDGKKMVIASTLDVKLGNNVSLEMFLSNFGSNRELLDKFIAVMSEDTDGSYSFKDQSGEGRISVKTIPDTDWKIAVIVPTRAFNELFKKDVITTVTTVCGICVVLGMYLMYLFWINHSEKVRIRIKNTNLNKMYADQSKIVADSGLGIWTIILKDGTYPRMAANDMMMELLGIKGKKLSEEEVYNAWYSNIAEEAIPSVHKSVQEMISGKFSENTYQWNHPEKGVRYVRCGGSSQKMSDGTCVLSGFHRDTTDSVRNDIEQKKKLKEALDKASSASEAKTRFLSNMSHDIRTPMNAILGFTQLMKKNCNNPDVVKDYLDKIEVSGNFLLSIINSILDLARIESGNAKIDEVFVDLLDENTPSLNIFKADIKKKKINFSNSMNVEHRYILVDVAKMQQITVNLLSNAIKYTPEGGSVTVDFKEVPCDREGYATYVETVRDTGIGMSQKFLEHIFEDFSRERNTTESKIVGTGLGMSIVKKLVDLFDGKIEIESELGKGSAFKVTMTHKIVDNPEEYIRKQKEAVIKTVDLEGKRVLLAEDNDLNAEIAIAILEDKGMKVDRAVDGVVCLDMLGKAGAGYYDIILMDIQMPNLNGYDTAKKIRASGMEGIKDIPVIAMTANAFEEDREEAVKSGMNGHVSKPVDIKNLMDTLSDILQCGQ